MTTEEQEIIQNENNFNYHTIGRLIKNGPEENDDYEQFKEEFLGNGLFRTKEDFELRDIYLNPVITEELIISYNIDTPELSIDTNITLIATHNIDGIVTESTIFNINGEENMGDNYLVQASGDLNIIGTYNSIESNELNLTVSTPE